MKVIIKHDGNFWYAKAKDESIFTHSKSLDNIINHIKEAVGLHKDINEKKIKIKKIIVDLEM